ncbi:hypothetical protein Microterr_27110 [Microbacterium terricola]|uniref:Uncharacterized protein n=1 Tax=Microbacterium terricola TaxID=344163 RepID=A0ABM8E2V5_9MICO|nr:hypothetical protein Microterr_27110 [Microbacterium terricola]
MLSYPKAVNMTSTPTLTITAGAAKQLRVRNFTASVHLVIDVVGYYVPQIHAVLSPSGGVYNGSPRVLSSTNLGTGSYRVLLDIDATGCTPVVSVHGGPYWASAYVAGSYIYANTYTDSGTAINLYWTLAVLC